MKTRKSTQRRKEAKTRTGLALIRHIFAPLRLCAFALALILIAPLRAATNLGSLAELGANHSDPLLLRITISRADIAKLRKEPRQYVVATVKEGEREFTNVAIHLKGALGSFRNIDDKPALTMNFSRQVSNRMFHASSKVHLNNSVEDPAYLNEKLGAIIFRKAGIPAPGVHHASVELNGRRLGLYVIKEGFTPEFLARNFKVGTGNLYDTDAGHEINEELQRDLGIGPDDQLDLKRLAEIVSLTDSSERWKRLPEILDVDEFVSFMAAEIMICHRDGYSLARNNYRLFHPDKGRFVFLPHGMDQLFQRPDFPWHPSMAGLVAQTVMQHPEGEKLYRQRLQSLLTNAFDAGALAREIDETITALDRALPRGEVSSIGAAAAELKTKIFQRKAYLERELSKPAPAPIEFGSGSVALTEWKAANVQESGKLAVEPAPDRTPSLGMTATGAMGASWRRTVLLSPGKYRFVGRAMTKDVASLPFGKRNGACIRALGYSPPQEPGLTGDNQWKPLMCEFTVAGETQEVQLLCELRASKGSAWFDCGSLKLIRISSDPK